MTTEFTPTQYTQAPSVERGGIRFFPTPVVSDVEIAFGARPERYFSMDVDTSDIPELMFEAVRCFLYGKPMPDSFSVDARAGRDEMLRLFKALATSFGPKHEIKEATMAYALWVWASPDTISDFLAAEAGAA